MNDQISLKTVRHHTLASLCGLCTAILPLKLIDAAEPIQNVIFKIMLVRDQISVIQQMLASCSNFAPQYSYKLLWSVHLSSAPEIG
jgi:hypothetical protein